MQTILEATMLLSFGLAWPVANLRMMRSKKPEGKGLAFTLIILFGYVAGATAKWLSAGAGQAIPGVFWLYTINAGSVAMNLALQWHFGPRRSKRTKGRSTSRTLGAGIQPESGDAQVVRSKQPAERDRKDCERSALALAHPSGAAPGPTTSLSPGAY